MQKILYSNIDDGTELGIPILSIIESDVVMSDLSKEIQAAFDMETMQNPEKGVITIDFDRGTTVDTEDVLDMMDKFIEITEKEYDLLKKIGVIDTKSCDIIQFVLDELEND